MTIPKFLRPILFFLLLQAAAFGQGWERYYPNISLQQGSAIQKVIPAPGGGYLLLIADTDGSTINFDFYVAKIDDGGHLTGTHHFDFGADEFGEDLIALSDGGYAVLYQTFHPTNSLQTYLLKLDAQFNQVYRQEVLPGQPISNSGGRMILENQQRIYVYGTTNAGAGFQAGYDLDGTPRSYHEWLNNGSGFRSATVAPNGDVVAVTDNLQISTNYKIYATRFDTAGVVSWTREIGTPTFVYLAKDVTIAPDGGFVVAGSKNSSGLLVKLDDNGQVVWEKNSPQALPGCLEIGRIKVNSDGTGYWATGRSDSYIFQIVLLKYDLQGNNQFSKDFGPYFTYSQANGLVPLTDGVLMAGYNSVGGSNGKPYAIRADANGDTYHSGVSGTVFEDFNNDCIGDVDSLDYGKVVQAWHNNILAGLGTVDIHGKYFIPLDTGFYKITVQKPNSAYHSCPDTIPVQVLVQDTVKLVNFTLYYHPESIDSVYGWVFEDIDNDCVHDAFEQGHQNWTVTLTMYGAGMVQTFVTTTDANGHFVFSNLSGFDNVSSGTISTGSPVGDGLACTITCPQALQVNFTGGPSFQSNIGVHCDSLANCAIMDVDLAAIGFRPCRYTTYHAHYCNNGATVATNAYVVVAIDSSLQVITSSIPWNSVTGNAYTFNLGDLQPEQCGEFTIRVFAPCTDVVGKTYCSSIHGYPDSSCTAPKPGWDNSEIKITAYCAGGHAIFNIANVGTGDMAQQLNYVVTEDNVLLTQNPFQLHQGEHLSMNYQPNGKFLRIETGQSPGFPGLAMPAAWVEGCGAGINPPSLGYINQYPLADQDTWLDVFCLESTNSYDPNDKTGFPIGVKTEHFVPQNTDIEYLIRFQNTGTAAADYVEVRDTIPVQYLDPTTVRPGASSHYYDWDMQGNGVVVFRFPFINLPDSSQGDLSHGFVKFRIKQRKDLPLGTKIKNKAHIYFDNNSAVITNQTLHTIGKETDYLTATQSPSIPNVRVQLAPNPAQKELLVTVDGLEHPQDLRFRLINAMGALISETRFDGVALRMDLGTLPEGVYFYELLEGNQMMSNGKLVKM
jgi:hypothetical protein